MILTLNRGLSYSYVLNELPFARDEIFVDAASSWGVGGFCGDRWFQLKNHELQLLDDV